MATRIPPSESDSPKIKLRIHPKDRELFVRARNILHSCYKSAQTELGIDEKRLFDSHSSDPTYGELSIEGVYQLLKEEKTPTNGASLIDLGSGVGLPVVASGLICPDLSSVIGVELSTKRHKEALRIRSMLPDKSLREKIKYYNQDILETSLKSADILFFSSLVFPHKIVQRMCAKFDNELKIGSIVFSSRKLSGSKRLSLISTRQVVMSWDIAHKIYCYQVQAPVPPLSQMISVSSREISKKSPGISGRSPGNLGESREDSDPSILSFLLIHPRHGRPGRRLNETATKKQLSLIPSKIWVEEKSGKGTAKGENVKLLELFLPQDGAESSSETKDNRR
ncbi:hypothetical protein AAMO2058_000633600 [Amorphochlora amoebiformis]